ncbi:MAG: rhamnulokinase family protein [Bryobacteraceae bacterium]|nr:rhamnulokinase family protein [Bryobacteraceae bacterium]
MKHYLAIDLGAESGRAILGTLAEGHLNLEELHRFPNQPVRLPTGLYWDSLRLFHEMQQGLAVAGRERKLSLDGIGVDTWGVDFGVVGEDGALTDNPRHYRDARNNGMLEAAFAVVPQAEIFRQTGLQFMQINSLYQLYAMKRGGAPGLQAARRLLFMPDLFSYWLTGVRKSELTIASTSQFYNPAERRWATELFGALGLDASILCEIVPPGTALGPLLPHLAEEAGLGPATVYATASHDTAAAVAAVPATGDDWCYISSGTWSLMGVEIDRPVINEHSLALNFTNEIGAEEKVRLLKNIAGLWLLQECRRSWALSGQEYSYEDLTRLAAAAKPFSAIIPPDKFLEPGHMPERIAAYCRDTGQPAPEQPGEVARAILEGLALRYRQVLESLESLLGRRLNVIHIVGGGSRNHVLNQFVADATQRVVIAGPTEATAAGNVLVQAMGAKEIAGLGEARQVVRQSFPVLTVEPKASGQWDEAYARFEALTGPARARATR